MLEVMKGQMALLTWRNSEEENTEWEYVVAKHIYDEGVQFVKEHGGRYMYLHTRGENEEENKIVSNQPTTSMLYPLFRESKPVLSKKTIFGKYRFKPKSN